MSSVFKRGLTNLLVGAQLASFGAIGCGSADSPQEPLGTSTQALKVSAEDVLGFETASAWRASSGKLEITGVHSEGNAALELIPARRVTRLTSTRIDSSALVGLSDPGTVVTVDLSVTRSARHGEKAGSLALFVAFKGHDQERLIGRVSLADVGDAGFSTLSFPVPESVRRAIGERPIPDASFGFVIDDPRVERSVLDHMRFNCVMSPHNCGACGHDCQGGSCVGGVCQPVVLASNVCPTSIALDSTNVYYTADSVDDPCPFPTCTGVWAVNKVAKAGGIPSAVASGIYHPAGGQEATRTADALSVWGGNAYWIEWTQALSRLMMAPTAGGASPVVLLDSSGSNGVARKPTRAVVANDTGVYWANEEGGVFRYIDAAHAILVTPGIFQFGGIGGLPYPVTLGVDATNVYFTSNDPPSLSLNLLNSAPIAGGNITTLDAVADVVHASLPLADTAIAADGNAIYWATSDQAPGFIFKVPVGGGPGSTFAQTSNSATVTSLAVDTSGVYWTENQGSGAVNGQALSNGAPRTFAEQQSYPFSIAVDDTAVYWVNAGVSYSIDGNPPVASACTGSVMKVVK